MRKADVPITVPMRYVRGLIEAAQARGLPPSDLLTRARISDELLNVPRARVSLKQFSRLYTTVASGLDDEMLGLLTRPTRRGSIEVLTRACATATALGDCAEIMARALSALLENFKVHYLTDGEKGQLVFEERSSFHGDRALAYEVVMLTSYAVMSWLVAQRLPLLETDFPFPAPRHKFELRSLLPGRVRFDRPVATMSFSTAVAAVPIRRDAVEIAKFIRQAPGSFIESVLVRGLTSIKTRNLLRESLPTLPSLNKVAAALAVSPRTLHRQLEAEGESFQSIKDHLRRDIAVHALTRTATPIKQIASDLGFSDQAAFQRAFAQWTGRPPGAFRHHREHSAKRRSAR